MKNKHTIERKLSCLYDNLYNIEDFVSQQQREFLLNEIDYYKTELLKIQIAKQLKEIENETSKD